MSLTKLLVYSLLTFIGFIAVATAVYFLIPIELKASYLKIVGVIITVICYLIIIIDFIFLLPTIHGAIYLPSADDRIKTMLQLANIQKGEKAVDIGSGDGRVVAALAQAGANAFGYEINPFLVWWSKVKYSSNNTQFHIANMWNVNYSPFKVVILFGMSYIMNDFEKKLLKELKPGARVICNAFQFPTWKESKKVGTVYLYEKK